MYKTYILLGIGLVSILVVAGFSDEGRLEPSPKNQYIRVEIRGVLTTGIMAIGGETTGFNITARGICWELDFGKRIDLRERAEGLNGQLVLVHGSLQVRKGIEIKKRWIVTVKNLIPAPVEPS